MLNQHKIPPLKLYYAIAGGPLGEKPPSGAWGLQTRNELLKELDVIRKELIEIINRLRNEGYEINISGGEIFNHEIEVFAKSNEIMSSDSLLIFAVGPRVNVMRALLSFGKPIIVFIKSGMHYYTFAEIFNARVVRAETDITMLYDPHDVFVVYDNYEELAKILRAFFGVHALKKSRILYIGTPYGWQGRFNELRAVNKKIGIDIIFLDHNRAYEEAQEYLATDKAHIEISEIVHRLKERSIKLELDEEGIVKGVKLFVGLKYLAEKYKANVITISLEFSIPEPVMGALPSTTAYGCMAYGASKWGATPCLAFSLLDDEGLLGVCEGDMTNLVAKTLLRYISNKPVAFANPSIPAKGTEAVFAHCTAPTKMLGFKNKAFKYILTTHFETNSPAAIKVLFEPGHHITLLNLSFNLDHAIIARGEVLGYTDYPICRSQIRVKFKDTKELYENAKGFHWSYVYGDYVDELKYALKLLKIDYKIIE